MSGGWTKKPFVTPGRPKAEIPRAPVSWWMEERYQADRASFAAKARQEQPRMAHRGMSPDRLEWKS